MSFEKASIRVSAWFLGEGILNRLGLEGQHPIAPCTLVSIQVSGARLTYRYIP